MLESKDFGKSEEATEVLLRKLDSVDLDMENQRLKVESLQETGAKLEHCGHPNRYSIQTLQYVHYSLYLLSMSGINICGFTDIFIFYIHIFNYIRVFETCTFSDF